MSGDRVRHSNWLVAAKRPKRRCFLILRCRLFLLLRSRIRQVSDCSPTDRERELGLDRRETGQFYPTDLKLDFEKICKVCVGLVRSRDLWADRTRIVMAMLFSTKGTTASNVWYACSVDGPMAQSYLSPNYG